MLQPPMNKTLPIAYPCPGSNLGLMGTDTALSGDDSFEIPINLGEFNFHPNFLQHQSQFGHVLHYGFLHELVVADEMMGMWQQGEGVSVAGIVRENCWDQPC